MERFCCHKKIFCILLFFFCYVCFQVNCSSSLSSFSSSSLTTSTHFLCPPTQSLALLQFKRKMLVDSEIMRIDNSSPKTDSWKEGSDCCLWDGLTCDEVTGNVIGLDLDCSGLQGTIEYNSSLFELSHLQWLNLAYNHFRGSKISPEFGRLTELTQLNLSNTDFGGPVPFEISLLSKLTVLDLSNDGFGYLNIDQQNFDSLVLNLTKLSLLKLQDMNMSLIKPYSLLNLSRSMMVLDLSFTGIQGKFPEKIFHLANLQEVYLDLNEGLTGSLPKSNWSSHLKVLDLSMTNFQGEIPDSIGNLKYLEILSISYCNFNGLIPASIDNLTQLTDLEMDYNNLTGELPSLSKLQKVSFISLSGNKLTGQIPEIFYTSSLSSSHNPQLPYHVNLLPHLSTFDLSENFFHGRVPSWLFTLPSLEHIDLSSNKLTGLTEQPNLSISLREVHLESNEIYDKVSSWLFALPSLEDIDVSRNELTDLFEQFNFSNSLRQVYLMDNEINGKIPSRLFALPSLEYIDVSSNKLNGPIKQFNLSLGTSLREVYLQDNEVQGSIPSSIFELVNLTILDISSNNLSGTVKFDMLSKSKNLDTLDLSDNSLLTFSSTTNMNYSLSKLRYLNLSFCNVSEFPMFLRSYENLETLDLSNSRIYGQILITESEGWKSLSYLDLSNNFLTYIEYHPWKNILFLDLQNNTIQGSILVPPLSTGVFFFSNNKLSGQIPPSICMLRSLVYLALFENNLSGIIPPCLGNFGSGLIVLLLQKNNLQGVIPDTFANGCRLVSLDLSSNKLEGQLPRSLVNCGWLEVVNVGNNMISGMFPWWLGTLSKLKLLILRSNRFYGPICGGKTNISFDNLQIIDLSGNEFAGSLQRTFFAHMEKMMDANQDEDIYYLQVDYSYDSVNVTMKGGEHMLDRISNILTSIDLSRNLFHGEIPEVLGKFKSLVILNLSHNSLTGNIPVCLANLTALESLDLSFNHHDGRIPVQLVNVTTLSALNLSYNQLSGLIPQGNQFNTFENDSFIGNKGLCGKPLSVNCGNDGAALQLLPTPVANEEGETADEFDWKFAMILGYASGVVIGMSIGYIVFSTEKPWWFVRMVEERLIKKLKSFRPRRGSKSK